MTHKARTAVDSGSRSESVLLLKIHTLAKRAARRIVEWDVAENIADDVVMDCLERMRAGTWGVGSHRLKSYVRCLVRRRAVDVLRRDQRRADREAEHARELTESVHAWMEPHFALEAAELDDLERAAVAGLPLEVLETYELVRDGGATYERAGRQMGVSRSTVAVRVARVRSCLERALLARENGNKDRAAAEIKTADPEVAAAPQTPTAEECVQRAFVRAIAYIRGELARREG